MMRNLLLVIFALPVMMTSPTLAQDADWSSWIVLPPNPSPYFNDWENNPNSGSFFLEYRGDTPVRVTLRLTLTSEREGQILSGQSGLIEFNQGPEVREITTPNIIRWQEAERSGRLESQILRTGRLPEGQYSVCVEAVDLQFRVLTNACATFSIVYPDPPYLIAPNRGELVSSPFPTFQWTPVQVPASYAVTYSVRIVELLPGQTPEQAMASNLAYFEQKMQNPGLVYPMNALTFEQGKTYVWQVQALDQYGFPVSSNDGKSQIWSFKVSAQQEALEASEFVYDGLSSDIDYTNSKTSLSANWATVSGATKYLYAIGTTQGGTDILAWTDNGTSTTFTRTGLSLKHKQKYYVSVKTQDSSGNQGPVQTSNGVVADTSMPTSLVQISVPQGKLTAEYLNTANFTVTWSGTDDASPVTSYDIQYKFENDLMWTTWLANTGLTSATFTAAKDGKYVFRSRAKDAAGNQGVFKDKEEDATTVDTKPPSSEVSALASTQTSLSFLVSWSGQDATSGIESYDIQVREDNGPWQDWLLKQTNTSSLFTGKAGHTYAFRSRAVDKAGNQEPYPTTADATTQVPASLKTGLSLIVSADVDSIVFSTATVDIMLQEITPDITLQLTGPSSIVMKVTEAKLTWYDEAGQQYATTVEKLSPPILLNTGESSTFTFYIQDRASLYKSVVQSTKNRTVHSLSVIYAGIYTTKQADKPAYSLESAPLSFELIHYKTKPPKPTPVALTVDVSPATIIYAPGRLSNMIDVRLSLSGPKGTTATLDEVINHWFKENDQPFKTLTRQLQPPISLKEGQTVTRRDVTMAIDQTSLKAALGGKSLARYKVKLEFKGKDQNGNPIQGTTQLPLEVIYYAALPTYTSLLVIPQTTSADYYPGLTMQEFEFMFSWSGFTGVTIDTYQETLIYPDNTKKTLPPTPLPALLKLKPGKKTATVYVDQQTLHGVPVVDSTVTFNLPVNIGAALKGQPQANYSITFTFTGKDDNGNPVSETTKPIALNIYSQPPVDLTVQLSPTSNTFDVDNLQRNWNASLSYSGKVAATIDSIYALWYYQGGSYLIKRNPESQISPAAEFKPPKGTFQQPIQQTIDDLGRTTMMKNPWAIVKRVGRYKVASFDLALEFVGKDSLGRRVVGESNRVEVRLREKEYPLTIIADPTTIITSEKVVPITYTISSNLNSAVTLVSRTTRIKKRTEVMPLPAYGPPQPGFKGTVTDEVIAFGSLNVIPANGLYVDKANIRLNLEWLLGDEKSVDCVAEVTYQGRDANGNTVQGRVYVPITVGKPSQVADTEEPPTDPSTVGLKFVLMPKVAEVQAIKDLTTITSQGMSKVFNGPVKLILLPSPFDSQKVVVDASNLSFLPKGKGVWQVQGGSLSKEAATAEKPLFGLFKDILKIKKISYNHSRANKLLINDAVAEIPILDKKIYFKNLAINKDGLDLKVSEQELSAFGLTFRFTGIDIQEMSSPSGDVTSVAFTVALRLKGKPKSEEFATTKLVVKSANDRTTLQMKAVPGKSVRMIPNTDYLNFQSFEFKEKANDDWVLAVAVTSSNLPIFGKLGPITGVLEYEKSGKLRGKLEPIKETNPGIKNDNTVIKFGKWGTIDLTYLGVQFAGVEKTATVDGKEETTWEFDPSQSFIGMAADLYMPFKGKVFGDPSGRIAIGNVQNPGIRINFNGDVATSTISVAAGKKLDLGPVFIKLTRLGITPYPFALELSGGLGVNMSGVVEGEVAIQGLKIDEDGNFVNFSDVVKGGQLSILKVVSLGVGNVEYSSQPSQLSFMKNVSKAAKPASIKVNSYFRITGAHLNIKGAASAGGGKFDELALFTDTQNKTSFLLRRGNLNIQSSIDLNIDFQYVNSVNLGQYLSVGGGATFIDKYRGTIYGKVGTRADGQPTWGFYLAGSSLDINLAGVTLDEIGGGFFYNPTSQDIASVKAVAGFQRKEINDKFKKAAPASGGPGGFAVFLAGGVYIGSSAFLHGRALMTVTGSAWSMDAELQAIKVGSSYRAKGLASLTVNWDPGYFEGQFNFGLDMYRLIDAKESENYVALYIYDENTWGLSAKLDITLLFVLDASAQLYIGDQGFLFDTVIKDELDLWVLSGGIRVEAMVWWRPDVSWGIYGSGKAWGEVLGGLVGAEVGLEGALLYDARTIQGTVFYAAGHLSVELFWIDVFSGRVWVSVGSDGWHGDTGTNSKYDRLISAARNMGGEMEQDMQKLADELEQARAALFTLNDEQRAAAGKALLDLVQLAGFDPGAAFVKAAFAYAYSKDKQVGGQSPLLDQLFNRIWNPTGAKFTQAFKKLQEDSLKIRQALDRLEAKTRKVQQLLAGKRTLLEGKLPTVADFGGMGSPVGPIRPRQITVGGKTRTVYDYDFDAGRARALETAARKQFEDMQAYRRQLVRMVKKYSSDLRELDALLYGSGNSVSDLTRDYASAFSHTSNYALRFLDHLWAKRDWASTEYNWFRQNEEQIRTALSWQARAVFPYLFNAPGNPTPALKKLIRSRIVLIQELMKMAGKTGWNPPDTLSGKVNWVDVAVNLGMEMWYNIPVAGFEGIINNVDQVALAFAGQFQNSNNLYQARWNGFTMRSDKVYNRKARLYTLLYDLLDQLSLEAGTRKLESDGMAILASGEATGLITGSAVWSRGRAQGLTTQTGWRPGMPVTLQAASGTRDLLALGGKAPRQPQARPTKQVRRPSSTEEWDFEKERRYVKRLLQVPRIVQLTGTLRSDYTTNNWYAKLILNWKAEHPAGVAEYSFAIPGYSQPVQLSDLLWKSPASPKKPVQEETVTLEQQPSYQRQARERLQQMEEASKGERRLQVQRSGGLQWSGALGNSATKGNPNFAFLSQAWRSVARNESMVIPFLREVHPSGTYEVWLRVRGAGGYTLERKATISVSYPYEPIESTAASSSDFGPPSIQSKLNISDTTPPSTPVVWDGGDTTSSRTLLYAKWGAMDFESGIQEYRYRVEHATQELAGVSLVAGRYVFHWRQGPREADTPWMSAGGQTELNIRLDKPMEPGTIYYIRVRAKNGAGLWSPEGVSDGIQLSDATPPSRPTVQNVTLGQTLSASWSPASDSESGVLSYLYALGTVPGAANVIDWSTTQGTSLDLTEAALNKLLTTALQKGKTYYFSVSAMNRLGVLGPVHTVGVVAK